MKWRSRRGAASRARRVRSRPSVRTLEVSVVAAQHRSGGKQHAIANTMQMRRVMVKPTPPPGQLSLAPVHKTPRYPSASLPHTPSPPVTLQVESCVISSPSLLVCVVCVAGNCVDKKITGLHGACKKIRMRMTRLLSDRRLL